jgi:hypothetical protein
MTIVLSTNEYKRKRKPLTKQYADESQILLQNAGYRQDGIKLQRRQTHTQKRILIFLFEILAK